MLAKKYRLPIQEVFPKRGASTKTPYFLLKKFDSDLAFNRFGVIISGKVSKKATERNKLKRTIFNALKNRAFTGGQKKDFLIIPSPKLLKLKKEEIVKQLQELLA